MFSGFQNYILQENLVQNRDAVLIAVSGGLDSVVLLELFKRLNDEVPKYKELKLCIAHCNFGLRGAESEADEQFVKMLAGTYRLDRRHRQPAAGACTRLMFFMFSAYHRNWFHLYFTLS